jgi:sulfite reductase beta subunit-like hemoprotein
LIKFHGSYQQDDRDQRRRPAKRGRWGGRAWQFMVRKVPGGRLTAEQYLIADELATDPGNQTLRITTRQDFQFHGVGKSKMKRLIRSLNERWMTTYGGCGDIARNTLTLPGGGPLARRDLRFQARWPSSSATASCRSPPPTTRFGWTE